MRRTRLLIPALALAAVAVTGCGGAQPAAPPTVTVTAPAPAAAAPSSSVVAPAKQVVLPDVEGRNGGIVYDELTKLGLTNFDLASKDEKDKVVLNPSNWTAVSVEPGSGTEVSTADKVVVTMTKEG